MGEPLVFEHYEKALASLKLALDQPLDDFMRDSVIQRFEYCMALSWKMLKRFLKIVYQQDEAAVRELFRLAERYALLPDPTVWFDYLEKRNLTSHTYNEKTAGEVYETAKRFYPDAILLLEAMKNGYARHKG